MRPEVSKNVRHKISLMGKLCYGVLISIYLKNYDQRIRNKDRYMISKIFNKKCKIFDKGSNNP